MTPFLFNDSWKASPEKDYFRRVLKTLRYHSAIERLDKPTTNIIFISSLKDVPIRHHFEDSSRHFKTYSTSLSVFGLSSGGLAESEPCLMSRLFFCEPVAAFLFVLWQKPFLKNFIQHLFGRYLNHYFQFRLQIEELPNVDLLERVVNGFKTLGIQNFAPLNILIHQYDDPVMVYAIRLIAELSNKPENRKVLHAVGLITDDDPVFAVAKFRPDKNDFDFQKCTEVQHSSFWSYFKKKTERVISTMTFWKEVPGTDLRGQIFIFGKRQLTRGSILNTTNIFHQSYDYQSDLNLEILAALLKRKLRLIKETSPKDVLLVIEHKSTSLGGLISKDNDLKNLLSVGNVAVACIEPESKEIYALEGNQFIQQVLKHVY